MTIFKQYTFEASHQLCRMPKDHKCARTHGHSYRLTVEIIGAVEIDTLMVMDFAALDGIVKPIIDQLDHHHLNDVMSCDQPTCEAILMWISRKMNLRQPHTLELWETAKCGARLEQTPNDEEIRL